MATSRTAFQEANEFPIEYAQSIIINQPGGKNGPLKFVDYGVQQSQLQESNDFTRPSDDRARREQNRTTGPDGEGGSY